MSSLMQSRTISISIALAPDVVYAFVSNPENLPKWAHGLARTVTPANGDWIVETPGGPVRLRFVPRNELGVLDHRVTLASGLETDNPMRVVTNGSGSELLFTLFQSENMSDAEFVADAKLVENDLRTLKQILESA